MNKPIKISERLKTIASFLPRGATFADIGSDHAYLPCYVCMNDPEASAVAGEINDGPYNIALQTVQQYDLAHAIDVRKGNGLEVIEPGEADTIVIAGMGGSLIRTILNEGKAKLKDVDRIIVQPNMDEKQIRTWLAAHEFCISAETMVKENGHIYEIIVADKAAPLKGKMGEKELFFGPILMETKSPLFYEKWQSEKKKYRRILEQIKKASQPDIRKIKNFEREFTWIEEVLANGKIID